MMKCFLLCLFSLPVYAKISGHFYSEFKRKDLSCMLEAKVEQKNLNEITFKNWDELCEDKNGNTFESSLEDIMTYRKKDEHSLIVFQGKDHVEVTTKQMIFEKDHVLYDFEVETDDGHLEVREEFSIVGDELDFKSQYWLNSELIIDKNGKLKKIKKYSL